MLEIIYALIAGLGDIIGGWLGLKTRISRIMPRYIIGFAAGVMISLTFLDVLPEINIRSQAWLIGLGFFTFYIVEKLVMLHACGEQDCEIHKIGGITIFGMALDNIVDGVGIAAGYLTNPILGLIITIGVMIHEIPQGITSGIIMKNGGYSRKKIYVVLAASAVLYPIGAIISGVLPAGFNGAALAFIAGDFLYIGASDLLPEAHKKFNLKVVFSVMAGLAFVIILGGIFGPL
ncbi:MAG: ZIP family metal transporter [Candidatus Aenigmarchaeota archaeon]|nr:ZIP family metal transporter [Candidatus Aenigmarchaeota archaeon]